MSRPDRAVHRIGILWANSAFVRLRKNLLQIALPKEVKRIVTRLLAEQQKDANEAWPSELLYTSNVLNAVHNVDAKELRCDELPRWTANRLYLNWN